MTNAEAFVRACRLLRFVREEPKGSNAGQAVEAFQAMTKAGKGTAWCASVLAYVGFWMFGKAWPLPLTASCDVLLEHARTKGWLRATPAVGMLGLVMKTPTDAIHVFVVCEAEPAIFATIEGNSNPDGGREGYGMFERHRGHPTDPALKAGYTYQFIDWMGAVP